MSYNNLSFEEAARVTEEKIKYACQVLEEEQNLKVVAMLIAGVKAEDFFTYVGVLDTYLKAKNYPPNIFVDESESGIKVRKGILDDMVKLMEIFI